MLLCFILIIFNALMQWMIHICLAKNKTLPLYSSDSNISTHSKYCWAVLTQHMNKPNRWVKI